MKSWLQGSCLLLLVLGLTTGCSMGQAVWYDAYTADGGNWERTDLEDGRVGSAFSETGQRRTAETESEDP